MLGKKMAEQNTKCWLVNTGWVGGAFGKGGKRCPLKYTRKIIDAIHDGSLAKAEFKTKPVFNLSIPTAIEGIPSCVSSSSSSRTNGESGSTGSRRLSSQLFRVGQPR